MSGRFQPEAGADSAAALRGINPYRDLLEYLDQIANLPAEEQLKALRIYAEGMAEAVAE